MNFARGYKIRTGKFKSDPSHLKPLESERIFQRFSKKLRQICTFHPGGRFLVLVEMSLGIVPGDPHTSRAAGIKK